MTVLPESRTNGKGICLLQKNRRRKNYFKYFSKFVLHYKPIWAAAFLILMLLGNFGGFELVGEAKNSVKKHIAVPEKDFKKLPHVEVDAKDVFLAKSTRLPGGQESSSDEKNKRFDFQAGEDPEFGD